MDYYSLRVFMPQQELREEFHYILRSKLIITSICYVQMEE